MKLKNIRVKHFQEYMFIVDRKGLDEFVEIMKKAETIKQIKDVKALTIEKMVELYNINDYEVFLCDEDTVCIFAKGVGCIFADIQKEQIHLANLINAGGSLQERKKLITTLIDGIKSNFEIEGEGLILVSDEDIDNSYKDIILEIGFNMGIGETQETGEKMVCFGYKLNQNNNETNELKEFLEKIIESL